MNIHEENCKKETLSRKKRVWTLLGRIVSGSVLILFVGFIMFALLLVIMYFI